MMLRWALAIAVVGIGALAAVVAANNGRFARRVAAEAMQMWSESHDAVHLPPGRLAELPTPVQRYLTKAVLRDRTVRTVRLRHGGTFRTKLEGDWLPIRGAQYFAADPPGFVWWGRARLAPGLWVDARDRCVGGTGSMLVRAESTFTIADSRGPELDQGALLRLLGEMVWFPTAFLDGRFVAWTPVDDRRARATLRVGGREVPGTFEFGDHGLPARFRAERHRDLGGGRSVLTPFAGEYAAYRQVAGLLVPHRVSASWYLEGKPVPYAEFFVERVEYDAGAPF